MGWSPDSRQVALIKVRAGAEDFTSEVWVVDVDLTSSRLVQTLPGRVEGELGWSPDGQQIVCGCHIETREASLDAALLFNADGSGDVQSVDHAPIDWFAHYWPQWENR